MADPLTIGQVIGLSLSVIRGLLGNATGPQKRLYNRFMGLWTERRLREILEAIAAGEKVMVPEFQHRDWGTKGPYDITDYASAWEWGAYMATNTTSESIAHRRPFKDFIIGMGQSGIPLNGTVWQYSKAEAASILSQIERRESAAEMKERIASFFSSPAGLLTGAAGLFLLVKLNG